jgi:hypothetical protein
MWGPVWVLLGLPCLAGFIRGRPHRHNGLQGAALRFHADVAVVLEHLLGNVPSDVHDGLIACAAFGEVGNQRVPVVVPTALHLGIGAHIVPCRLEGGDRARRVTWTRLSEGKDIPLGSGLSELLPVPCGIVGKNLEEGGVQRDGTAFAGFRFAAPYSEEFLCEVDLLPSQVPDLGIAHPGVERQRQREIDVRGASLAGLFQHPVLFRRGIGLSDCLANLQLEHLSFAEPNSEQVARIAQDAQQKTDFFVDALWSSAFTETGILVLNDCRLIEIDKHLAADEPF